jgi:hypothetical protein
LRLAAIYEHWHQSISQVLLRAQQDGLIIETVDPRALAVTIVAIIEGSLSCAKVAQDLGKLQQCGSGLTQLLQLIRTQTEDR